MLSCIRCNQILNEGEKFCHLCGGLGHAVSQNTKQTSALAKNKDTKIFIVGFCIFAICFIIIIFVNEISIRRTLTEANTGRVVHVGVGMNNRGSVQVTHYVNGERYTGWLRGMRSSSGAREGMQFSIFYDPADPRRIRAATMGTADLFYAIWIVILVLLFLITMKKRFEEAEKWW